MGERGPAPRRDAERRRTNSPDHPIVSMGPAELAGLPFEVEVNPAPPEVPENRHAAGESGWHPMVQEFWESLKTDPARKWMTSADWTAAMLFCETMSRELSEHTIAVTKEGELVKGHEPVKGATLAAFLKFLDHIGVTEAARLRLQKEITLFPVPPRSGDGKVVDIREGRKDAVL